MAARNFNHKQALEIGIRDVYAQWTVGDLIAATGTLDLTNDITLTKAAAGPQTNTYTFTVQVAAAAANPTNTILAVFTGTSAAITCTITPNDGTNNAATPVNLTTANLVELINTGSVTGKTVTVTDASSLRALQTAAGGGAQNLADGGEGDGVAATFAGGGANQPTLSTTCTSGVASVSLTATGEFTITLSDRYAATRYVKGILKSTTAQDIHFINKTTNVSTTPSIVMLTTTGATATNPANGSVILWKAELKNTENI